MYKHALRIILSLLICLNLSACTTIVQGGVSQTYTPIGHFVKVMVVNSCSQELDIMTPGKGVVATVKFGDHYTVVLERQMFVSQYSTSLKLMVRARNGQIFLGTATRTYSLNAYNSGQEETWEVNSLDNIPRGSSNGCTG